MKIEEYIKDKARYLGFRTLIAPDIPKKKLNNCINFIAHFALAEYILIIGDATVFGKTSSGFAFTGENFYFSNDKGSPVQLLLSEIAGARYYKQKTSRTDNIYEVGDKIEIYMRDNSVYIMDASLIGFDCSAMEGLINGIVKLVDEGQAPKATKQNVSVAELNDYYKLIYLKILCNYAYIGDSYIDSNEYSTIQNIVVRIELSPSARNELRTYMADIEHKEKTGDLLYKLCNELEYGSYDIVRYSLMQDVLYLHGLVKPNVSWTKDGFIGSLLKYMHLRPEHLELMEYAIDLNKQMVTDDANIVGLQTKYQDVVKNALCLRIPLMTLYCSGSVYSIDTYKKIFNGNDKAQLSIQKQRELMLQTVIKNTQETVNHLVSDMNSVSEQLVLEIKKGLQSSSKIEKLSALLIRLSKGAAANVEKTESTEQRVLYNKLPKVVDMVRLEDIRREQKCELEYQTIMNCYDYDQRLHQARIKINLDNKELYKLLDTFNEIRY